MKLDKSKPFGEIHGVAVGYRYEQDGHCFDSEGNLVGEPKTPKGEAAAKGKGAKPADAKAPKTDTGVTETYGANIGLNSTNRIGGLGNAGKSDGMEAA